MSSLANKNTFSGKNITSEWLSATGTFIGMKVFHKQWRSYSVGCPGRLLNLASQKPTKYILHSDRFLKLCIYID